MPATRRRERRPRAEETPTPEPAPASRSRRRVAAGGAEKVAGVTIQRKALADLQPHPKNPRKHPKEGTPEWNALRESLKLDYFDPIVWNSRNGKLVSGHLRTKILTKEGFTHADVVVVDYDERTHLGRMLSANHLVGEDDWVLRKDIFEELFAPVDGSGVNVEALTGAVLSTVEEELEALRVREAEEDAEEETSNVNREKFDRVLTHCLEPTAQVSLGEVWKLGRHYLVCASIINPPFVWRGILDRMTEEENQDGDIRFVPYPDPYWPLTERPFRLCLVQPDPFLASHIVDNYNAQVPEDAQATLVEVES